MALPTGVGAEDQLRRRGMASRLKDQLVFQKGSAKKIARTFTRSSGTWLRE